MQRQVDPFEWETSLNYIRSTTLQGYMVRFCIKSNRYHPLNIFKKYKQNKFYIHSIITAESQYTEKSLSTFVQLFKFFFVTSMNKEVLEKGKRWRVETFFSVCFVLLFLFFCLVDWFGLIWFIFFLIFLFERHWKSKKRI